MRTEMKYFNPQCLKFVNGYLEDGQTKYFEK